MHSQWANLRLHEQILLFIILSWTAKITQGENNPVHIVWNKSQGYNDSQSPRNHKQIKPNKNKESAWVNQENIY